MAEPGSVDREAARPSRWRSMGLIVVFDIAGPLAAYSLLRSHGSSTLMALVLSGILPAVNVAVGLARHRRLDALGAVVLIGIATGTVIGLASSNAKWLLLEGSVPTGIFGLICLASLWSSRPLMFRFALEFRGRETADGREFAELWRYGGFRHVFRVITAVWGMAFLAEAVVRVIIVESTSTGTAFDISKVMPYAVAGVAAAWTTAYGQHARRRGERRAATAATDREL